jgi:type IV pilus assembly protein PilF
MKPTRGLLVLAGLACALAGCVTESSAPRPTVHLRTAARDNVTMGMIYLRRRERTLAMHSFERALKLDPRSVGAHDGLALLNVELGRNSIANQLYRQALSIRPRDPLTLNAYGVFLCHTNQIRKGVAYLLQAGRTASYLTPEVAYTNAGICELRLHEAGAARRSLRRALSFDHNYPPALWQLAKIERQAHHLHRAARHLLQLADLGPRPAPEVLWLLIRTEWALGAGQVARRYGAILLRDYPGSPEALAFLRHPGP